ncbi:hypothetical protein K3495_g11682 [Podosphaera aphanis]|nr:hypothetical protein K3495_g11682 [Podosphaera aphanis]
MGGINQPEKALYSLFTRVSTNSKNDQPSPFHQCGTSIKNVSEKKSTTLEKKSPERYRKEPKETALLKSSENRANIQNEDISPYSDRLDFGLKRCRTESLSDPSVNLSLRPNRSRENSLSVSVTLGHKYYPLHEDTTALLAGRNPEARSIKGPGIWTQKTVTESLETCLEPREIPYVGALQKTAKASTSGIDSRPKKILQLNPVTGTIGSPPAKKSVTCLLVENSENKKIKLSSKSHDSKIVKIKYNAIIGPKLEQILRPQASSNKKPKLLAHKSNESSPKSFAQARNVMHPFFQGKCRRDSAGTAITAPAKTEKETIITTPHESVQQKSNKYNSSLTGDSTSNRYKTSTSNFRSEKTAKITKFPGTVEPAWPSKEAIHVRGFDEAERLTALDSGVIFAPALRDKKSKGICLGISYDENMFTTISNDVSIKKIAQKTQKIDLNEFPPIPTCLRIPTQHSENGLDLQRRLRTQLHSRLPTLNLLSRSSSEDEICSSITRATKPVHPALLKAYSSVATSLSAFDKGECESQAWTQKYSPQKAEEVLQSGVEALILKEWLCSLTVNSINTGISRSKQPSITRSDSVSKRKRKSTKQVDFIVSSDEEGMESLDQISELEDEVTGTSRDAHNHTLVRGGTSWKRPKDGSKVHHTILISGPNGCGKSAAVYAAAKELDFEVFEINSSSKRSGKDIMEKIGDMTQNHHVGNVVETAPVDSIDEDRLKLDAALAKDLETGRQGTMNSFFKPKSSKKNPFHNATSPSFKGKKNETWASKVKSDPAKPIKEQKQSLILIEEAETIFKEDSQFWATIENIMAISRRPIIVTCNDESVVPLAHKSLHAILRFQPPPIDLAVDYMLMVAACEGHLIKREAVKALYEERRSDLRASLLELNFWCQFAVGDVNRGLSWYSRKRYHQSQPQLSQPVRVLSEGTYEKGMGWISQDVLESDLPHLDIEEEILRGASDFWDLDLGDWENSISVRKWATKTQSLSDTSERRRAFLEMFADFAESMSASDLVCNTLFGSENQIPLDPSIPKLCNKTRDDYPVAHKLVEAFPTVIHSDTSRSISFYLRSRARNHLQVTQHLKYHIDIQPELSSPSESQIINLIRQKRTTCSPCLQRTDFSRAFDPISFPQTQNLWSAGGFIEASQFDRPQRILSEDLAPYVRGIVAYDLRLQREREKMSNLISEGGTAGKRRRTTRAAMSALEGGKRSETRREKYFGNALNSHFVRRTGMQSWINAALRWQAEHEISPPCSS